MSQYNNNQNTGLLAQEYCQIQLEYGVHFEKLSMADRAIILAVLAVSLHTMSLGDPFRSMTSYNLYLNYMSEKARDCCYRLMGLTFDHITCACSALLSQLNLPSE